MGCDIHAHVEYKAYDEWWHWAEVRIKRDYTLFGLMAGVRDDSMGDVSFDPRGFPDDASWLTRHEYTLWIISDEPVCDGGRYIGIVRAEKFIAAGWSKRIGDNLVTDPDWHTPSWLTGDELSQCIGIYCERMIDYNRKPDIAVYVVRDALRQFEHHYGDARLVFWFDN